MQEANPPNHVPLGVERWEGRLLRSQLMAPGASQCCLPHVMIAGSAGTPSGAAWWRSSLGPETWGFVLLCPCHILRFGASLVTTLSLSVLF